MRNVDTVNWSKEDISEIEVKVNSYHGEWKRLLTAVLGSHSDPMVFLERSRLSKIRDFADKAVFSLIDQLSVKNSDLQSIIAEFGRNRQRIIS